MSQDQLADAYEVLAADRSQRAARIRERSDEVSDSLALLKAAMKRRASELELSASVLCVTASGHRSSMIAA